MATRARGEGVGPAAVGSAAVLQFKRLVALVAIDQTRTTVGARWLVTATESPDNALPTSCQPTEFFVHLKWRARWQERG